jgi:predicted acetyltransferase
VLSLTTVQLVRPASEYLFSYVAALEQGWSPDSSRGPEAAREELARINADPTVFLDSMEDREANGPPITLPDSSVAVRVPGITRWLWDGEFCGSIGLRWQPGTTELPPHCLGHIGYAVVPWKQGLGYAKHGLRLMLAEARAVGLPYVDLTTDPGNIASQRVIAANGGVLVERFTKPPQFGSKPGLRFRISLAAPDTHLKIAGAEFSPEKLRHE